MIRLVTRAAASSAAREAIDSHVIEMPIKKPLTYSVFFQLFIQHHTIGSTEFNVEIYG